MLELVRVKVRRVGQALIMAMSLSGLVVAIACGSDNDDDSGRGDGGANPGAGGSDARAGQAAAGRQSSSGASAGPNASGPGGAAGQGFTAGRSSAGGGQSGAASMAGNQSSGGAAGTASPGGGRAATGGRDGRGGTSTGGASDGGADEGGGGGGGTSATAGSGGAPGCGAAADYDAVVLCDDPVGFWAMTQGSGSEPDLSNHESPGTYKGGSTAFSDLPNGDKAAKFNGSSQYLTIASKPAFSIPTTGEFTWEAWISPTVLQFPNDSGGYVDWMGKCADYSPTCEWEARLYNTENSQDRCNRFSAYVFNPSAGLGSGADFQPTCGLIQAAAWYHVVGEYTLKAQPSNCSDTAMYPGSIEIWVNGVQWNHSRHGQTGCMSQYDVLPEANDSPVNIGTMAGDAWFQGAIGKVAFYDHPLTQAQITNHYRTMTGEAPTGSCADTCSF